VLHGIIDSLAIVCVHVVSADIVRIRDHCLSGSCDSCIAAVVFFRIGYLASIVESDYNLV